MGEISSEIVLGKAIQNARKIAGITQQELCQRAELSYSTLAKIERGAIKTPSVFTVQRIAQVLGLGLDELLGGMSPALSNNTQKRVSKNGISFVYFDINGCLVHFYQIAFTRIAQDTGVSSEVIEKAFWHFNDAVCRGEITLDEFNRKFAEQMGIDSIDFEKYYMDAVEPIVEMHDLVRWTAKNFKVGLLSNIMPGFLDKMIARGLLPNVPYDSIIDSSVVKMIKPEVSIYELATERTSVPAEQILFVDDSRTNLMAAERLGWHVFWFDDMRPSDLVDKIKLALEF